MTTLATLRAQCRALLASATAWPDATLDAFIQDSIRAYSADFPRTVTATFTCEKDEHDYAISAGHSLASIISVVFDSTLLAELPPYHPDLTTGNYYAWVAAPDDLGADEDNASGTMQIGPTPAGGEMLTVTYTTIHRIPTVDSDDDIITVPQAHWEALIAFIDFRCHWMLESAEAVDPDPETMLLTQLGDNSRRAWVRYKELIARFQFLNAGRSAIITWDNTRIY